jgi:FtsZ-binding cell division protein ZapB
MSLPKEILELQDKRANLENETRTLAEEQRRKKEKVKALEQMIIVELTNKNEKTRQDLSQLDSKINDLEHRLEQIRQEPENPNDDSVQVSVEINDAALEEPMEEEVSTDTSSENSDPSSENEDEMTSQRSEKKKREFF